jgi:hypothetical protein
MPQNDDKSDEVLNRQYGVDHAEFVRPSDEEPARPPTHCERCGSPDIVRIRRLLRFALVAALVIAIGLASGATVAAFLAVIAVAIAFLISPSWLCHQCGYRW